MTEPVAAPADGGSSGTNTDVERLIEVGRAQLARIGPDGGAAPRTPPEVQARELPDGLGLFVWQATRGGGAVYVAPDESVLVKASATDFETGLAAFRQGRRTPAE
jgi:hypothetical protein